MKITIGITTHSRPEYLEKMRRSLYASNKLNSCNIRVYDDCSPIWDVDFLTKQFPSAKEIIRREKNLGPSRNMRQMYLDFLNTNDDLLFAADSDLIFHPDWIDFIRENFNYADGIMSLYNSAEHSPISETIINSRVFLEKNAIGSAGSVMNRRIVKKIVNKLPESENYDWKWSELLRKDKIRLLVSNRSYVQHLGLDGFNCNGLTVLDFGLNFYPGNKFNQHCLIEFFQNALLNIKENQNMYKLMQSNINMMNKTQYYKLGHVLLIPAKWLIRLNKKVIKKRRTPTLPAG